MLTSSLYAALRTAALMAIRGGVVVAIASLASVPAAAVTSQVLAEGFSVPIEIVHAGDGSGRLFVAEQGGAVWILNGTHRQSTPFLDLATLVVCCGERGLLGLAFHPQYRTKMLRLDVDRGAPYAIPPSNPFADGTNGRPEIFAVGLRNPWRFAFDRATGDLYIGDVGQNAWEEVDRFPAGTGAGANLGWRVMEGSHCTGLTGTVTCNQASLTLPILEYGHTGGNCSITGGTVYRGLTVAALAGRYVYADFCTGDISSAAPDRSGAWQVRSVLAYGSSISTFGEDEQGELYFADYARGQIRHFVAESGDRGDAVEYYHAGLDHYFVTAAPSDIHALDAGVQKGWRRTGESFGTFTTAPAGFNPVCRFYIPPSLGDSHFVSASPQECVDVRRRFPSYVEETPTFMNEALPNQATGTCPAGLVPVYRVWNQRVDSNHRYTTQAALRDLMVVRGGIVEGYGIEPVAMCAPK